MEQVDIGGLKLPARKGVWVRVPPPAHLDCESEEEKIAYKKNRDLIPVFFVAMILLLIDNLDESLLASKIERLLPGRNQNVNSIDKAGAHPVFNNKNFFTVE